MTRTLVVAALLLAAGTARADDPVPAPPKDELKVENGAFVIQGKIQKPQVVVVIRRETLDQGIVIELMESFLDEIVEATQEPPF